MQVKDIAHTMPISDTQYLSDKLLPAFGLQTNVTYAVHAFSSTPQYALILGDTFSSLMKSERNAEYAHTSQASYTTHVNDSVLIVIVKPEGGSHGS